MPSNKHFEIELVSIEIIEVLPPEIFELLAIVDLPNLENPYGNKISRGKFVNFRGEYWLFDKQIVDIDFQKSGYSNEISNFNLEISFDAALELNEIDKNKFLYSIARQISNYRWRNYQRGAGSFYQIGKLEEGSIRANIYAGIVAVGGFVAAYPALKTGFRELLTDTQFVSQQISTALRAAKIPEPYERHDKNKIDQPLIAERNERKRRKVSDIRRLKVKD